MRKTDPERDLPIKRNEKQIGRGRLQRRTQTQHNEQQSLHPDRNKREERTICSRVK